MMFLKDGRTELYQWDTGREIALNGECSQFHFSNKVFGHTIDVDATFSDGISTAKIPDFLLQSILPLNVYAYVGTDTDGYTKISKQFNIIRRNKPADYVFTPTDQMTIEDIKAIAQSVRDDADAGKFDGKSATIEVGTVTSLNPNEQPRVENVGTPNQARFNFAIPRGQDGAKGDTGAKGDKGDQGSQGESGVYVGSEEPPVDNEANVWINPTARGTEISQSDWNVNDSNNPAFVKNRFGGYDIEEIGAILYNNQSTTFQKNGPNWISQITLSQNISDADIGKKVIVTVNDIDYSTEVRTIQGIQFIGNVHLLNPSFPDTGETFLVFSETNASPYIIASTQVAEPTKLGIKYGGVMPVPISEKYIPDNLPDRCMSESNKVKIVEREILKSWTHEQWQKETKSFEKGKKYIYVSGDKTGEIIGMTAPVESPASCTWISSNNIVYRYVEGEEQIQGLDLLSAISGDGIVIKSSSGKKQFKITVDDTGTLKTTEVI